jgi:glycosyltransferase involved in cell wall biosynthesis
LNILFTSHKFFPDVGGIEVNSEILAGYFHSCGHSVRVVTQTAEISERQFDYLVFRRPSLFKLLELYRWADIVYQNNIELGVLWPILFMRRPFVVSVRTWLRASNGKRRSVDLLKKWVLSRANAVIAISEAIRRDSFRRAIVIGNPYRSSLFRIRTDINRQNSVVFVGRLVSDKGADLLISAFSKLRIKDTSLSLIGSGPEEASLHKAAEDLGIQVKFTGALVGDSLVRELNRHTILVVPSLWDEPFGNVALEGMACGCAVLGSNGGGLVDAIGSAGLLFERGNVLDLTYKLNELLCNPALVTLLQAKAQIHLANHREEVVSKRYLDVLSQVCTKCR